MKVLVTSSRMPFALDAIRKLGERGHEVYACDSYEAAPGSHSKYLAGHFTTASATDDPEQFVADVERDRRRERDRAGRSRCSRRSSTSPPSTSAISKVTRLYAPPFRTLAQVHDKGTFQELCDKLGHPHAADGRRPRPGRAEGGDRALPAVLRPRGVLARRGRPADQHRARWPGTSAPTTCHPTEANPWLVQEFVDGPMHCTYSCIHDGEVATHMSYRAPRQWEHSTGIQFLSVDPSDTLPAVEKLATELDWDGQMSLDFVDPSEGLMMIECNPRPTDGVLLMTAEELERGPAGADDRDAAGRGGARASSSTSRSSARSSASR